MPELPNAYNRLGPVATSVHYLKLGNLRGSQRIPVVLPSDIREPLTTKQILIKLAERVKPLHNPRGHSQNGSVNLVFQYLENGTVYLAEVNNTCDCSVLLDAENFDDNETFIDVCIPQAWYLADPREVLQQPPTGKGSNRSYAQRWTFVTGFNFPG